MPVVFNTTTFLQLLIVAVPAGIAYGLASLLDGDSTRWAEIVGAIGLVVVDALWRLAAMGPQKAADDDGREVEVPGAGPLALVKPDGGGHIFFLPTWLIGGLVTYGLFTGFFR